MAIARSVLVFWDWPMTPARLKWLARWLRALPTVLLTEPTLWVGLSGLSPLVTGGGAQSDMLMQTLCDVLAVPIRRPAGAALGPAAGAARLASVAAGSVAPARLADEPPVAREFVPDATAAARHQTRFTGLSGSVSRHRSAGRDWRCESLRRGCLRTSDDGFNARIVRSANWADVGLTGFGCLTGLRHLAPRRGGSVHGVGGANRRVCRHAWPGG